MITLLSVGDFQSCDCLPGLYKNMSPNPTLPTPHPPPPKKKSWPEFPRFFGVKRITLYQNIRRWASTDNVRLVSINDS